MPVGGECVDIHGPQSQDQPRTAQITTCHLQQTVHRRYHDPTDNASLADLVEEYSVGRPTIHRIISGPPPRA